MLKMVIYPTRCHQLVLVVSWFVLRTSTCASAIIAVSLSVWTLPQIHNFALWRKPPNPLNAESNGNFPRLHISLLTAWLVPSVVILGVSSKIWTNMHEQLRFMVAQLGTVVLRKVFPL
ncbi:uncharacterized protein P174DRAFT_74302 [Aspergillus novofumigatus IBT 16806]|uniref:Uncharacterized protein n=1 Tax=Aspergillus novofumigatus (strain IBT 16806) TaxID=1392255 RepID=A0A2I1BSM8_ASPN1|nr:uncharacterized protein P174DRAFT_74302 [Aspergillus novofumigatus IBT 16806]PKX88395.1 hypothetical protein P174DRAFT_74302 [Aspergillus novofumigatus IBT 16806]